MVQAGSVLPVTLAGGSGTPAEPAGVGGTDSALGAGNVSSGAEVEGALSASGAPRRIENDGSTDPFMPLDGPDTVGGVGGTGGTPGP